MAQAGREHDLGLASVPCTAEEFARYDVLVVSTAHSDFKDTALYARVKLVVDTRNLMAPLGLGGPGARGPEVFRSTAAAAAERVLVVVPTYNERENVAPLVARAARPGRRHRRLGGRRRQPGRHRRRRARG